MARKSLLSSTASIGLAALCGQPALAWDTLDGQAPIVIGHRGASGYLPEHTLEAYQLAIEQGADFIEPDLVSTSDGVLVARHEPNITNTTNIADLEAFAGRKHTVAGGNAVVVDGVVEEGWFAFDFTADEFDQFIRARQARAGRPAEFNDLYKIPTLNQVIDLAKQATADTGRTIGIHPETKHPTFHDSRGLSLEEPLVASLTAAGWTDENAPVFIQSFETSNLKEINNLPGFNVRLVQLVDANDVNPDGSLDQTLPFGQPYDLTVAGDPRLNKDLVTHEGLAEIATYADGVGPWKPYLLKTIDDGTDRNGDSEITINDRLVVGSTGVIEDAHSLGLFVHTWTMRNDASQYGFPGGEAGALEEMAAYFLLGVDGVFTDFPDTGVAARALVPEPTAVAVLGVASGFVLVGRRRSN